MEKLPVWCCRRSRVETKFLLLLPIVSAVVAGALMGATYKKKKIHCSKTEGMRGVLKETGFLRFYFSCLTYCHFHLRLKSQGRWAAPPREFNFFFCFLSLLLMGSMSSRCCLKMQSMKVLLSRPLKVTANLSRATLSRSVKSKNQAHISWKSRCASPRASLCVCVPAHLIYKRSIEICMSPMMPALKIHSNREYIDSYVIELSLSSLCHGKPRIALRTHVLSKARGAAPSVSVSLPPPTPPLHTATLGASPSLLAC